jgi:hypothetical protein
VPQITIDSFGNIIGIADVTIAIDASQIVRGTIASARISGSYTGITGVGTLTVGTWNASAITTPYGGTGQTSYTAGDTLYYASGSALSKLAIGASTYINTSSGTAPQWTDPATITVGKATNLVGGAANRIAYQTATDTTGFIVAPTVSNTYLEWSGTAFQWTANPLGTVTSVAALTLGTTGTDLSSTVANPTTTPVITLNVPTASAANRGALSAADWTTFNSKAPGVTFTTSYIPYGQGTTTLNQSAGLQFDGTNFTTTGFATATSFRPSASTVPTNGMYLPAANTIGFATNSTLRMSIDANGNSGFGIAPLANIRLASYDTNATVYTSTGATALPVGSVLALGNLSNTNGGYVGISFGANQAAGTGSATYIGNFSNASSLIGTMVFGRRTGSATYAESMRISNTGGVSIGNTTDPGATNLSVTGTGQFGTTVGVGAATPSASGAGITFPATQSASTNVNTLDDYEEGTFTPTIIGTTSAGTGTYSANSQIGRYTKIGNRVYFTIYLVWTAHTGTGNIRVTGLPFTSIATTNTYNAVAIWNANIALTALNLLTAYVNVNAITIEIQQYPTGGGAAAAVAMDTSGAIMLTGHYEV